MAGGNFFSQYTVTYDKGEAIYRQGEAGNCMFVIKEGQVGLYKNARGNSEQMGEMGKGDFFGELSILESCPRTETAKALTKCFVVVIHRATFVKMLKSNMEIAIRMLQKLSTKIRLAEEQIDNLLVRLSTAETQAGLSTQPGLPQKETRVVGKLVSMATNRSFILNTDRNLIGRFDPVTGIKPEVDLTYEDDTRSVSRRHAIIFRKDNEFFIQEEIGVLNGTFVNGTRAGSSNEQMQIKDQDMVNIGMLAFKFHILPEDQA
ncbi:MAG: cyclic nucleotide-binding domain-containing protein [Acidobacteriota bacterium]|nr:cyclic nucleotide-binding domain-containing protein [Acidobacteriota bacterium]